MTDTLLPDSWTSVQLADLVVNAQSGFASGDKAVEGGISHLRMNNIGSDGELALDLIRTVPEKLAKQTYALGHGDILVCTTNSSKLVGKTALFNLAGRYVFSNHLTRLRPVADLIDSRFLHWNLWLHWKRGGFEDKCKHWVNQSTLPKEELLATEIPFPPIAEQRRIAVKVEKVLEKVSRSVERLERIPTILKRFRQSVLAAACSGRLTANCRTCDPEDAGWEEFTVGSSVEGLKYGTAQKCSYDPLGVPVLRIPNVANGTIDASDLKYAQLPRKEFEQLRLKNGDILLIRSNGSVSLVGKSALVRKQNEDFAYAGYLIRLRPKLDVVDPAFLNLVLSSYDVRLQIELEARSTSGVNNINGEEVRALKFVRPPMQEQQEIVRRVESLFALADQLEARYKKGNAYVDKLTQSILAKAFRGELVPQDPNDEPAEKLLERIRGNGMTNKRTTDDQQSLSLN